ncbi:methenyltetrahydrofolate cyclohydrolase [Methylotuvimicrobium alcaliphilum]|uniref:Methenyltetrahydrofolate cyclohydrolase n=1 Tax=Methylotuvimicrobium alcaliphilum (strain DSM 19304 / NCIMB 14124 / VKM B-2133 / 20Z) TaxID=1091494 RepID=G4SV56_META2|nr:methenyltetrahydrofolate cyclohydrolase [Methylotuvimicrobium alcaliphilum]CCE25154.1 Methenyltetrahydrofolate cyclohydrolase [Methylotuvimicrobium alcaliphilum 20Z]
MTNIKDKSLQTYLDELASKTPTPGGGSAAALMGAQAAALVGMVCNLTIGKPKYAEVEAEMGVLLDRSEALRERLTGMIKADVDVFDRLMACYGMPKETEQQKAARSEAIQSVLKEATEVPLECARACFEAIDLCRIAAEKGNAGVISDAGVAVMSAYAGLKSAALNVYINVGSLKDKEFADRKAQELESILEGTEQAVDDVYRIVKERL